MMLKTTIELLKQMDAPTEPFIKVLEMQPEERGMEENFIYVELAVCDGDEKELRETVDYLLRPIFRYGDITVYDNNFYLGGHRLMCEEEFEFVYDGEWFRSSVITIRNKEQLELFELKPGRDRVRARMRF